jgi:hypothetical protein
MALLSFRGIDTPSLAAQGEQRRPSLFNIQRGNSLMPKTLRWNLIGMVHGHWDVPQEAFTDFNDSNEQINMGMAIIIPINKVVDFVKEHPEFKKRRDAAVAAENEKNLPTMD